jgi:signal peptidase II
MLKRVLAVITAVLLVDQASKIYIKTTWSIGQRQTVIPGFFELHFIENNGMAFGMALPGEWGKIVLSLFRVIAVGVIGYYIFMLIRDKAHKGFITCVALIFAGALGNIIDSAFYGVLFGRSTFTQVAEFLPAEGGYNGFLRGFVVDMLHFTVKWPEWVPYFGKKGGEIFPPIFNVADAAITVGVFWILIKQRSYFPKKQTVVNEE